MPINLQLTLVLNQSTGPAETFSATGTVLNPPGGSSVNIANDPLQSASLALDIVDSSANPVPVGSPPTPNPPMVDGDASFTFTTLLPGDSATFDYPGFVPFDLAPGAYTVTLHYIYDPSDPSDPNFAFAANVMSLAQPFTVT